MAKELKEIICRDLASRFSELESCVLVDFQGLNAEQTQDFRSTLRKSGIEVTVVQNRLAQRVFSETGLPDEFRALFIGPTAILHGEEAALTASKGVVQWLKKNENRVVVKGGLLQGRTLLVADVQHLATVPDRASLLGQLLSMMLSPAAVLANAAQSLLGHFPGCAKARRESLDAEAGPPETGPVSEAEPGGGESAS